MMSDNFTFGQMDAPCACEYKDGVLSLQSAPDETPDRLQVAPEALPATLGTWFMACPSSGLIGLFACESDELGRILGVTASTVRRWRMGAVMPNVARISALRYLGLAFDGREWRKLDTPKGRN